MLSVGCNAFRLCHTWMNQCHVRQNSKATMDTGQRHKLGAEASHITPCNSYWFRLFQVLDEAFINTCLR